MIYVVNPKFKIPNGVTAINTTSRSNDFGRELSPFLIGPCKLYGNYVSKNMENAWQFSKVYEPHLEDDKSIGKRYFEWAEKGWNDTWAHRYPMGKDKKPLFSYWDGDRLNYIDARKKIYIPLYSEAVSKTKSFKELKNLYTSVKCIYLIDFDAHNFEPDSFEYEDLLNNANIKVGHAYVLSMMLENRI